MNVLLSIKPEFADKILNGYKRYEFRKTPFRQAKIGDHVLMYATTPKQRIVGMFDIGDMIHEPPEILWRRYGTQSGLSYHQFFEYYADTDEGHAIEVQRPRRFQSTIDPNVHLKDFTPPMSFQYMGEEFGAVIDQTQDVSVHACD